MRNKKDIDYYLKKHSPPYRYYFPDRTNIIEEAWKMEKNYICNCIDGEKDFSPQAINKRFLRYIEIIKNRR